MKMIDITGEKYGRLTVLSLDGHQGKLIAWKCQCDCGEEITVVGKNLKNGNTKSCGCIASEVITQRNKDTAKHGMTGTPTFISWDSMKQRCTNPNHKSFKHYRGYKICDRWLHSFENFLEDMGVRPEGTTLDRKDTNGNYEPSNCRWATVEVQNNNRNSNRLLTYQGKTQSCVQWSREYNIPEKTFLYRIKKGWSMKDALTIKVDHGNSKKHILEKNRGESTC